jgi:hypothetical protein
LVTVATDQKGRLQIPQDELFFLPEDQRSLEDIGGGSANDAVALSEDTGVETDGSKNSDRSADTEKSAA